MDRETVKQALVEFGWDVTERQRIRTILRMAEEDPECRQAATEYDALQAALRVADRADAGAAEWAARTDRIRRSLQPPTLRLAYGGAAAAALLVLAAAIWLFTQPRTERPAAVQEALRFEPAGIRGSLTVFREVAELFGPQTGWVLVADEGAELGLSDARSDTTARLLLLRFVVTRGDDVISRADLVIVPGQPATLTLPLGNGLAIQYDLQTSLDVPTRLSLWARVYDPAGAGRALAALSTSLTLTPGQASGPNELTTTAGHYGLYVGCAPVDAKEPVL